MTYLTRFLIIALLIFLLPALFKIAGILLLVGLGIAFFGNIVSSFRGGRGGGTRMQGSSTSQNGRSSRTRPDWWTDNSEGEVTLPESALKKDE